MNTTDVKRTVIANTISGYWAVGVRMVCGLFSFRLLFQGLSQEEFGFWSLLWAMIGYAILVDFGFGYSAQKRVAELSVLERWEELGEVLSTILVFYAAVCALILGTGLVLSNATLDFFKVSAANRSEFYWVLIAFVIGVSISFPLGVFQETLRGQQRIVAINVVLTGSSVVNVLAAGATVWLKWSFLTLTILILSSSVLARVVEAKLALDWMPKVRIRARDFSWKVLLDTSKFSMFAYANTLGNVVKDQAAQPVIGALFGVSVIGQYQAGNKVGEFFGQLTRQLANVLSPTAAHLKAQGDSDMLRKVLLNGMRFSALLATPLYILCGAYMDGVIRAVTGVHEPTHAMILTGELVLLWYYSQTITHSVFGTMYMMAGQERRLMWRGIAEAGVGFILSVAISWGLKRAVSPELASCGVALGSVLSALIFGWIVMWSWLSTELQLSRWRVFRVIVVRSWASCVPMLLVIAGLRGQTLWHSGSTTPLTLLEGGAAGIVGVLGVMMFGLPQQDRDAYIAKARRLLAH